ncbi:MAG: 5-formyltetrahydrofolate cyclo-ligase [Lachnospiraceae bacterium]|nr:5-formyltetrahydrofolate cyclo-ligase [Lachnospiraceae bacterium]
MNALSGLTAEKKECRKRMRALRDAIPEEDRNAAAGRLLGALREMDAYTTCDCLLTYAPIRSELDVSAVTADALSQGKAVYLPRTEAGEMTFYRITSEADLVPGEYGICVPAGNDRFSSEKCAAPLILLPGLAFDSAGNRMGYGGGYYDRYLEAHPELIPHTIAVGYVQQMTEALPVEGTDIRPAQLLLV